MSSTDYVINPDRFKKFFNEIDTRRTLLATITDIHCKLINHFASLDEILSKKSQTLDTQIEKFKGETETTLESLRIRESSLPGEEIALAARVEELKNLGISDLERKDSTSHTISDLLRMGFRRMDSKGLVKFLSAKRKESAAVRAELAAAAEEAVDLLAFVLEAVEDFVELKIGGEKVGGMTDRRWACGILIQDVLPVAGECGGARVSRSLKERAVMVLEKWKGVLGGGVGSAEAAMFLQMVIKFGLKEKFGDDFLRNLVLEFASRREMGKLAVALGFGDKMSDIIEELVKTGKEIEAVNFAFEAGLTEQFPPATLLKSCLKNCQKTDISTSKDGPSTEDANNELNMIRAIIRCVEDHKLESEFTIGTLKKRVVQLEKSKTENKKKKKSAAAAAASTSKPSNKRSLRLHHSGDSSRPPKSVRLSNAFQQRNNPPPPQPPPRQPSAASYSAPHSYTSSRLYESNPTAGLYGASYGGAHGEYGIQYSYPTQDIGAGGTQTSESYGTYGAAPLAPTYPATL